MIAKKIIIVNRGMGAFLGGGEIFDINLALAFKNIGYSVTIITSAGVNSIRLEDDYPSISFLFINVPFFRKLELWQSIPDFLVKCINFATLELDLLIFEVAAFFKVRQIYRDASIVLCGEMIRLGSVISSFMPVTNILHGPANKLVWLLNMNWICFYSKSNVVADGDAYKRSQWLKKLKYNERGYPQPPTKIIPSRISRSIDILWVGRLENVKGADRIPELVRFLKANNKNLRIDIIGGGTLLGYIKSSIGCCENVNIHGELLPNEITFYYLNAKRLVMLSRYDNWPIVACEALASGCHVFAPDVGGVVEMSKRYGNITVFNWEDGIKSVCETILLGSLCTPEDISSRYVIASSSWENSANSLLKLSVEEGRS